MVHENGHWTTSWTMDHGPFESLKPKDPERISDPIDRVPGIPLRTDAHHANQVMGADDIDAGMPVLRDHHAVGLDVFAFRAIDAVKARTVEWRERQQFHALEIVLVNVFCRLFHSLSPVHVRIIE